MQSSFTPKPGLLSDHTGSYSANGNKTTRRFRKVAGDRSICCNIMNIYCFSITFICSLSPFSKVPAFLNCVDIAGLVKGASEGQGLGNAFLSHISACDAIFHMSRKYFLNFYALLQSFFWIRTKMLLESASNR